MTRPVTINGKTVTRPALLSSTVLRRRIAGRQAPDQAVLATIAAVDRLAGLFDGLLATRESPDPLLPREANALRFRDKLEAAQGRARALIDQTTLRISTAQGELQQSAAIAAGVAHDGPHGMEIRQALRQLPQADRDNALKRAFETGDRSVISAVMYSPTTLLVGPTTLPLAEMGQQFIGRETPEIQQQLADLDDAAEALSLAGSSFTNGSQALRDYEAVEERADQGHKAAEEAAAKLDAAMAGAPSVPSQEARP